MSHLSPYPPPAPPRSTRPIGWFHRWRHWLLYPTAFIAGAAVVSLTAEPVAVSNAGASPAPTVTVTQTAAPAVADAGDTDASNPPVTKPTSKPTTTPATTPTTKAAAKTSPAKPVTPRTTSPAAKTSPAATTYRKVSSRQWKLIAKNPDAHIGETIVVYGTVSQFDSATGDDGFRANVDAERHAESYEYETNTVLVGDSDRLAAVVEDDLFSARVTVLGSYSYDTQIGGNTTVPQLNIDGITILK